MSGQRSSRYLISLAAVAMLSLAACATDSSPRTAGQTVDDSVLTTKVKAALIENKDTPAHNINVQVYRGEVQLNGFVNSAAEKTKAGETAQRIAGVNSVRNNLQVKTTERSTGEVVDDAVITSKVKAALVSDDRTKAYQIQVTTKEGTVQLGGFVGSNEAKLAASEVAMSVSGVKSVANGLEVKG